MLPRTFPYPSLAILKDLISSGVDLALYPQARTSPFVVVQECGSREVQIKSFFFDGT
jgi:hypothetical protein